jgi:hypothetical protein
MLFKGILGIFIWMLLMVVDGLKWAWGGLQTKKKEVSNGK